MEEKKRENILRKGNKIKQETAMCFQKLVKNYLKEVFECRKNFGQGQLEVMLNDNCCFMLLTYPNGFF